MKQRVREMGKEGSSYMERVRELAERLSQDRLRVAVDFLEYLKEKEEWDATWEILQDETLRESVERGKKDIKEGRWVRWEAVRRDV